MFISIFIIFACFAVVIFIGAPYIPTLKQQQKEALSLLNLKPGQTLLELGSGDGRMLLAAGKLGIKSIGYEINPILYLVSLVVTFRYRKLIKIHMANYWAVDWPAFDGIYVFLLQRYMAKLHKKITRTNRKNIKVVSYGFTIPNKKAVRQQGALFLYKY